MQTSVLAVLLAAAGLARADSGPAEVSVEAAIRVALERNAGVREADADVAAARARLGGARIVLPENPEVELAIGPRTHVGERSTDLELGLSQQVEIAGQRGVRTRAAEAALTAAEARRETVRARIAADVQESFGNALAARARVALAAEAVELARRAHGAARERFGTGASSRLDLNAAAVERSRAERELLRLEQETVAAVSALKLLVGEEVAPAGDLERWMSRAQPPPKAGTRPEGERPQVLAARRELDAARAERDLAGRSVVPNLRLGAVYAREEGAEIVQGTVGFAIPLFRRNQQERGVAAAQVSRAEAGLAAATLRASEEQKLAVARLAVARRNVAAFSEGALAAARDNAALATEGYEAGKLGFLELLVARRDALATREAYIEALEALNAAEAQVVRATAQVARGGGGDDAVPVAVRSAS